MLTFCGSHSIQVSSSLTSPERKGGSQKIGGIKVTSISGMNKEILNMKLWQSTLCSQWTIVTNIFNKWMSQSIAILTEQHTSISPSTIHKVYTASQCAIHSEIYIDFLQSNLTWKKGKHVFHFKPRKTFILIIIWTVNDLRSSHKFGLFLKSDKQQTTELNDTKYCINSLSHYHVRYFHF